MVLLNTAPIELKPAVADTDAHLKPAAAELPAEPVEPANLVDVDVNAGGADRPGAIEVASAPAAAPKAEAATAPAPVAAAVTKPVVDEAVVDEAAALPCGANDVPSTQPTQQCIPASQEPEPAAVDAPEGGKRARIEPAEDCVDAHPAKAARADEEEPASAELVAVAIPLDGAASAA